MEESKKMGRPRVEIDWEIFAELCKMQCTLVEIASFFKCSEDTIERRIREKHECTFAELFKRESAGGKSSLRRAQFKAALDGNTTMQIWLGKQYLDQKDKSDLTVSTPPDRQFNLNFINPPKNKGSKNE